MGNVLGVIHGDEAVTFIIFKIRYDWLMMKVGRRAEESKHGDTTNDKWEPKTLCALNKRYIQIHR